MKKISLMLFLAFLLPGTGYCGNQAVSTIATVLCKNFICAGPTYKDSFMTVKIEIVLNLQPGQSKEDRKTLERFYRQICYVFYRIAWMECEECNQGGNNIIVIKELGKVEFNVND